MAIEEAVVAKLNATGAVTAALGADTTGRRCIYHVRLPQKPVYPCMTYTRVSMAEDLAHDGPIGYQEDRLQVDHYAETSAGVRALAGAVRDALNGFSATVGGVTIHVIMLDNEVDDWGDLLGVWRITQDYRVHWERT